MYYFTFLSLLLEGKIITKMIFNFHTFKASHFINKNKLQTLHILVSTKRFHI